MELALVGLEGRVFVERFSAQHCVGGEIRALCSLWRNAPKNAQERDSEREGFEPPVPFRVQWFSRPPPSTTRPSLHCLAPGPPPRRRVLPAARLPSLHSLAAPSARSVPLGPSALAAAALAAVPSSRSLTSLHSLAPSPARSRSRSAYSRRSWPPLWRRFLPAARLPRFTRSPLRRLAPFTPCPTPGALATLAGAPTLGSAPLALGAVALAEATEAAAYSHLTSPFA